MTWLQLFKRDGIHLGPRVVFQCTAYFPFDFLYTVTLTTKTPESSLMKRLELFGRTVARWLAACWSVQWSQPGTLSCIVMLYSLVDRSPLMAILQESQCLLVVTLFAQGRFDARFYEVWDGHWATLKRGRFLFGLSSTA